MTEITVVIEPPLPDIEVTLSEVGLVGPAGPGVPAGGTTSQALVKASDADYDTEWADVATGPGGGSTVSVDADGTVVVDGTAVELATDADLAAEASTRASADTAEASARAAADTALDGRVDVLEAEQGGSRPPSGGAGGVLSGSYPNPGFAVDMATQAELDAEASARANADAAEAIARTSAISAAINGLIASAPGTLDTLDELAAALGDDPNFATTVMTTLAGKQPLDSDLTAIAALSTTVYGRAFLELADAAAGRTALGLGTAATHAHGDYDVAGAAAAAQAASQPLDSDLTAIAALTTTTFGRALLTMADDAATKTALALTKADVGLGSVDNTADTAKPVSTAQQTALNLKANLASPALTGTPTAPTPATSDSSTTIATTAHVRAQRTAQQLRDLYLKPTAAEYETISRAAQVGSSTAMTSGTLYLVAIALPLGYQIGRIVFGIATGATSPTNYWFTLFNSSRVMLARTDDQLTAAMASGRKSLLITQTAAGAASSFTTTYEGLHYLGIMVAAATPGALTVAQSATPVIGDPPVLAGASNTGQTTPPAFPFTANAPSGLSTIPWAYVAA